MGAVEGEFDATTSIRVSGVSAVRVDGKKRADVEFHAVASATAEVLNIANRAVEDDLIRRRVVAARKDAHRFRPHDIRSLGAEQIESNVSTQDVRRSDE